MKDWEWAKIVRKKGMVQKGSDESISDHIKLRDPRDPRDPRNA